MLHIINAKYYKYLFISIILIYVVYLFIDKSNSVKIVTVNDTIFSNSIRRYDTNINALILGGSNALRGISAEGLSNLCNLKVRNFSKSSEGGSSNKYKLYLYDLSKSFDRRKIKLVLYSSNHIYNKNKNNISDNNIVNTVNNNYNILLPRISLLSYFKMKLNPIKATQNKYGDYIFDQNQVLKNMAGRFNFTMPNIDSSINVLLKERKNFASVFPSAKFIVIPPPIYVDNPNDLRLFHSQLKSKLRRYNIDLLIPQENYDNSSFWEDDWHLNSIGRKIRTKDIFQCMLKDSLLDTNKLRP